MRGHSRGSTGQYTWPCILMVCRCNFFTGAEELISGFQAKYLLANRGYDTDAIIRSALQAGMTPVIPPKKNRKVLRDYDKHIYKLQHLVENAFLYLKRGRGIATRYTKTAASFVAAVQIRCIALWLKIY